MNPDVEMTLEEAVSEVLVSLEGLDLEYQPELNRFRVVTRMLNRALRANSLEQEWSYYSDVATVGTTALGQQEYRIRATRRPRKVGDDAVRLVDADGKIVAWAYFLPRASLSKYQHQSGLWVADTRRSLIFNRPIQHGEEGLSIQMPVMREPRMFRLPDQGDEVPEEALQQTVDFEYPDLIVARAAQFYAETDPIYQPRVQTLEKAANDRMYQLIERDDAHTDAPFVNDFVLPISGSIHGEPAHRTHPHSWTGGWD